MLADLTHAYGTSQATRQVIANGITSSPSAGAHGKQPFALAAGRLWDVAKNLKTLTAAAERLPEATITVAGDPGDMDTGRCRSLGVLGTEALADQRRRAAVFAAPARYEPFGLAILEAARDHCALVLGDIPSLRELWDGAAVFVDPGDSGSLTVAIEELLASPAQAQRFGELAHRRSLRFGAGPMAGAYHALYDSLAGKALAA
jgi:glycosyltransferase involved in cell wall biosynthesis